MESIKESFLRGYFDFNYAGVTYKVLGSIDDSGTITWLVYCDNLEPVVVKQPNKSVDAITPRNAWQQVYAACRHYL